MQSSTCCPQRETLCGLFSFGDSRDTHRPIAANSFSLEPSECSFVQNFDASKIHLERIALANSRKSNDDPAFTTKFGHYAFCPRKQALTHAHFSSYRYAIVGTN